MLTLVNTILVIVDVQGKLANLMYRRDDLYESLSKVIRGAQVLDVPILWAEQNPSRLGTTIPEVAELLTGKKPIAKMSFSCIGIRSSSLASKPMSASSKLSLTCSRRAMM
jgi:hypothetical protein